MLSIKGTINDSDEVEITVEVEAYEYSALNTAERNEEIIKWAAEKVSRKLIAARVA